MMMLQLLRA
ncbi:UNVERIFIED_CONTAM: hypothetical protein GTU68_064943 [Idotea baltica]|nr:hypothetical protein [Idotea baltica]